MSFADNPVWTGSADLSTIVTDCYWMTDSAGLSLILLVEVIETLLTLYRESRDHSTSKKNGKNITRLTMTSTVGQHFLTMATDRVRLSSTNAPLASLARCAPVLHDQSGQLKRAA